MIKLLIGILVLILGFPLGTILSRVAKDELKSGQKWFKLIILVSFTSAIFSLILGNDVLLFSFLFIAIVTSRSIKN